VILVNQTVPRKCYVYTANKRGTLRGRRRIASKI